MRRISQAVISVATITAVVVGPLHVSRADHKDPREPHSSTQGDPVGQGITRGDGTWEFIRNFKANPGTDLEFFRRGGRLFASAGTLGQADAEHVGQRILRLLNRKGKVAPRWVADHSSASCPTANPSGTTGLQHDVQVTSFRRPKLLVDTTDATGRCHDPDGAGLELVDISKIGWRKSKPREVHLTRHEGGSHTVTVDATRPWIVYNSSSQFAGAPWIDVLNIKSCLKPKKMPLKKKRRLCRPKVYRIVFQPDWSRQRNPAGELVEGSEASCHDITARPGRIYCAGLNATLIFDVRNLTRLNGSIKGTPLKCEVVDGTRTKAKVTDCATPVEGSMPQAKGWRFLGTFNHAGSTQGNTNHEVPSREGIAVAHEADPTHDQRYMFVTDERGGGVVPGGASCTVGADNTFGNGGVHVFDISNPSQIDYAQTPDGDKAVFVSEPVITVPTFCTAHVMELIPKEQRFVIAWYSQGIKIVDYFIDANGRWTLTEVASLTLPNANTWVAEDFKIVRNEDGTKTYYLMASDIERGIDILSWTGPPNPIGAQPATAGRISRFVR